jgi:hypothetical protein
VEEFRPMSIAKWNEIGIVEQSYIDLDIALKTMRENAFNGSLKPCNCPFKILNENEGHPCIVLFRVNGYTSIITFRPHPRSIYDDTTKGGNKA